MKQMYKINNDIAYVISCSTMRTGLKKHCSEHYINSIAIGYVMQLPRNEKSEHFIKRMKYTYLPLDLLCCTFVLACILYLNTNVAY